MGVEERLKALEDLFRERSAQLFVTALGLAEELSWLHFVRVRDAHGSFENALKHAYLPYLKLRMAHSEDPEDLESIDQQWKAQETRLRQEAQRTLVREQQGLDDLLGADFEQLWQKRPKASQRTAKK